MGRITNHPVLGSLNERKKIFFSFNNTTMEAYENETIAAALLASDIRVLRYHEENGAPRSFFCNIGHCMECRVTVNGCANQRACITPVTDGMNVQSGQQLPNPIRKLVKAYE